MDQTRRHGKSSQLEDFLSAKVIKRSVSLAGHMTSVSLEEPFWDHLNRIASEQKLPLSKLILQIDEKRQTNLSSDLRLFVLHSLSATK